MFLIVNGTGHVGGAVARALLADGHAVRVLVRDSARAEPLRQLGAEVVLGDLRDPPSLAAACRGVEKLLMTAHAMAGRGANSSHEVDFLGNRHLLDAAHVDDVQHCVFISTRGAASNHPVDFFRYKFAIEEYLRRGTASYTILRPPPFMETWAAMIGDPIVKGQPATIYGRGENPINFISERDVVRFALIGLLDPGARNQTIEIGGPENLTLNQVVATYEAILGVTARVRHIPAPMVRLMTAVMRPFDPVISRLAMTACLLDTADMRFDPDELLRRFPMKLVRLEEVVRESAAAAGRNVPGAHPA